MAEGYPSMLLYLSFGSLNVIDLHPSLFKKKTLSEALASTIAGQGSLVHQFVISVNMRSLVFL